MRHDIRRFPVVITQPVSWGEMDVFGHLNNVTYHVYFESARVEYLTKMGVMDGMYLKKPGIVVARNSCVYWSAVRFPDTLQVGARVSEVKADRFTMQYVAFSERQDKAVATGEALIVVFDYDGQVKAPIPASWKERIEAIEAEI